MAVRSLLLAAVVGIAAAGAFLPAAAQSRSSVSISVGAPAPYYGHGYDRGYDNRYGDRHAHQRHRAGYAWVPAHWVSTHRGRVWVPGQYVPVQRHGYGPGGYGPRGYDGYGGAQVIYRSGPTRVVPRSYYPPGYLSPYEQRRRRGW